MERKLGFWIAWTVTACALAMTCLSACQSPAPGGGTPVPALEISGLKASIGGDGIISLTWTEAGSDGHVEIRWAPDGAAPVSVAAGIASYNVSGLEDATSYDFTVACIGGDGAETATLTASAVTAPDGAVFIADADGLNEVGSALGGYYVLLNDIDMTGRSFAPIGNFGAIFSGIFDGNGKEIANLAIASTGDYVGLFGVSQGTVKNLGVTNVNLSGGYCVGGLVGMNYGIVDNCYSTGSINATQNYIGGLVGNATGAVTRSYSTCAVQGFSAVGGLLGAGGTIAVANCYASGDVSGTDSVGGLIGYMFSDGSTTNCYAIGTVSGSSRTGGLIGYNEGPIAGCYYNSLNTGNSVGTSTSLDDMRLQATYAGWDFDDVWAIDAGINGGYPYLRSIDF